MHVKKILAGLVLCITAMSASAHSTEPVVKGPLNPKKAYALAQKIVDSQVRSQMLDASWKKRKFKETKNRVANDKKFWVVSYANAAEPDTAKQILYVFFDDDGKYLDANHDGKLWGTAP